MSASLPEVWLRGPVPRIPALLQPVAHGLLQCREEVARHVPSLSTAQLWERSGGAASIGYHLRHAAGSLDRLLTYARGEALNERQRTYLAAESEPTAGPHTATELVQAFDELVELALAQLRGTDERALLEPRAVGRLQLPSTVIGLLFHAAEHTQRHVGQLITTSLIVRTSSSDG